MKYTTKTDDEVANSIFTNVLTSALGIQSYVRTCVRELGLHNQIPVHEKRCSHLESSPPTPIRCNSEPCPPSWEFHWTDCSVSCDEGIQQYIPQCKQELASGAVQVSESLCAKPKPVSQTRTCKKTLCENLNDNELGPAIEKTRGRNEWATENWSQVIFLLFSISS